MGRRVNEAFSTDTRKQSSSLFNRKRQPGPLLLKIALFKGQIRFTERPAGKNSRWSAVNRSARAGSDPTARTIAEPASRVREACLVAARHS